MQLDEIVGIAVVVASISIKIVGEPDQIRRNWMRKSTVGVSPVVYGFGFISYCLWTLHGVLRADPFLILARSVGIITTGIVLFQMWKYRVASTE
jgi:uncharacterized protein with PQ loop repeat